MLSRPYACLSGAITEVAESVIAAVHDGSFVNSVLAMNAARER